MATFRFERLDAFPKSLVPHLSLESIPSVDVTSDYGQETEFQIGPKRGSKFHAFHASRHGARAVNVQRGRGNLIKNWCEATRNKLSLSDVDSNYHE